MPQSFPLVIGHRGASAFAPENTLEAFRLAFEKFQADMIEFDVHLSKDGVPVILHDARLERTTQGKGYVSKYSARELKVWNVPTLEDVFISFPKEPLAIEIKENSAVLTRLVMTIVKKFGAESRVIVGSKYHTVSQTMRREFPNVCRFLSQHEIGMLAADFKLKISKKKSASTLTPPLSPLGRGKGEGTHPIDPQGVVASMPRERFGFRLDRPEFIAFLHERKISVFYWTINDRESMKTLWARGADGIITNDPVLLREVLTSQSSPHPHPLPDGEREG